MFNSGTANLTLTDCTVSGNSSGGGHNRRRRRLANYGTATLTDCTISGNYALLQRLLRRLSGIGGGVFNSGTANLTLTGCTVSGNSAVGGGGGVFNSGYASLTLTDCTFSGNSAYDGGGVFNGGTANLTDCTVSGNSAEHPRRRSVQRWHGDAHRLHRQRQLRLQRRRPCKRLRTANLTDCTVSGNSGGFGGGVFNYSARPT